MQKTLILLLILISCTQAEVEQAEPILIKHTNSEDSLQKTRPVKEAANITEIKIDAEQSGFFPSEIKTEENEKVRLIITAQDANHTFTMPSYGINEEITIGEEAIIEFTVNKKGTFLFYCEEKGHTMQGKFIVR